MIAIDIKNLCKNYKERKAVDNLSLQIKEGEIFALLGQNGAGKTTTIKMLSCLTKPTSGDAIILGNSIVDNPIKVKELINVSPQETAIASKLSVFENLELIGRLYGEDKNKAYEKALEMLNKFSLTERKNDKCQKLSGGLQRRLSIAMALISEPKILFLDEPTLGLDVRARHNLWDLINEYKGKITIILTTHYLEEAESLADRIAILDEGKLKEIGTVNELKKKTKTKNLEEAFLSLTKGGLE